MQGSWVQLCLQSLEWLVTFCPKLVPLSTEDSLVDWLRMIAIDSCWKGRINAAVRSCKAFRHANAKQFTWQCRFEQDLLQHGVSLPGEVVEAPSAVWQCDQCPMSFPTKRGLAMHSHKSHGYRNVVRYFAVDHVCNVCMKMYHCRARLRTHLQSSSTCLNALTACFLPVDESVADAMDAEERERNRLLKKDGWWSTKAFQPVLQCLGPSLPPAGHEGACEKLRRQVAERSCPGDAFHNLQGRLVQKEAAQQQPSWWVTSSLPPVVMQSDQGVDAGNGQLDERGLGCSSTSSAVTAGLRTCTPSSKKSQEQLDLDWWC